MIFEIKLINYLLLNIHSSLCVVNQLSYNMGIFNSETNKSQVYFKDTLGGI